MLEAVGPPGNGLAPFATQEQFSLGRRHPEPVHEYRGEYQRDRDRIIHSTAFRRLVYKTQVFVNHEGDLYRTRLTHSLEVAQIARTVARLLKLNEQLVEAICLAHDLGHTPFGHAGQDSLNHCMEPYGGFEHNLQSLRVVDELEDKYAEFPGLNLTFETREGILKHCSRKNARLLGPLGRRFLERRQPSLEAQLANLADEIAYNNHDVDDGLRAGLISIDELLSVELFRSQYERVRAGSGRSSPRVLVHETVRGMINCIVTDLLDTTRQNLNDRQPRDIEAVRASGVELVQFSETLSRQHRALKNFLRSSLYRHDKVLEMSARAKKMVRTLFRSYMQEPHNMPEEHSGKAGQWEEKDGEAGRARAVADYVAGMTDRYAIAAYGQLVGEMAEPG